MFNTGYSTDKRRRPSYLYFKNFRLRLAAVRQSGDDVMVVVLVLVVVVVVVVMVLVLTRCNDTAPRILIMSYSKYIAG